MLHREVEERDREQMGKLEILARFGTILNKLVYQDSLQGCFESLQHDRAPQTKVMYIKFKTFKPATLLKRDSKTGVFL